MKGIHIRRNRALFRSVLFLSILFTGNSQATFTASYVPDLPSGTGATAEEACVNLATNITNFDIDYTFVSYGVVNSAAEVTPTSCSDDYLTVLYPACLLGGADSTDCQDAASVIGFPDLTTIEVLIEDGKALAMISPSSTVPLKLVAIVRDSDGKVLPNIRVGLSVEVKIKSGGHEHDSSVRHQEHSGKLSGTSSGLNKIKGLTKLDGYKFTFIPPIVSGDHKITAICLDIDCGSDILDNILVGVDNLTSLGAGNWSLVGGAEERHTDNHYLTSTSISRITDIAQQYNARYLGANLYLNDASLIRGGLFDIKNSWNGPHHEHRKGTVIDVRANNNTGAIPPRNWKTFSRYVRLFSSTSNLERFYDKTTGKEIIGNRHFHVRLEGRRE